MNGRARCASSAPVFSFAAEFKSRPEWNAPSQWRSMLRHYKRDVRIG